MFRWVGGTLNDGECDGLSAGDGEGDEPEGRRAVGIASTSSQGRGILQIVIKAEHDYEHRADYESSNLK